MQQHMRVGGRVRAGRLATAVAVVALLPVLTATATHAQTATAAAEPIETVVVTGSAIKGNPDVLSSNPITVIGQEEIARDNSVNIQKILQQLPSVGSQGNTQQQSGNFGGNGFETIDLRNLGPARTLVLVDGQRFVQSSNDAASSFVDLNNIPTDMIDHIEVLRDGASPIYGSDALAGVVNFVLKKNYSGVTFNSSVGSTDKGDGTQYSFDSTVGSTFERGDIVIYAGFDHTDPVLETDRQFAKNNALGSALSSYFPGGHYIDDATGGSLINLLGNGNGGFRPYDGSFYDTSQVPYLINENERKTVYEQGTYNLYTSADFTASFMNQFSYTDRQNLARANPDPFFAQTTAGALGLASATVPGSTVVDVLMRSAKIGPRDFETDVDTYRLIAGFEGTLFENYNWQVDYNNGVSQADIHTNNLINQVTCCAALTNINFGNLSGAAVNNLRVNVTEMTRTQEDEWSGQISGPAFNVPYGKVEMALGGDVRTESLSDTPDYAQVNGIVDQGGNPTHGNYNVGETFAEVKIPILTSLPFAQELSVDGAARYSDYSNFGEAETWKATVNWAPVDDIRFRSTASTAFRAPSVGELYLANTQSYVGLVDPCDVGAAGSLVNTTSGATNVTVKSNCAASLKGIANPATFNPSSAAQQVLAIEGGNPALSPETSRNLTFGSVITPHDIPDLQITADYFRIRLSNQIIDVPDPQTQIDGCYTSVGLTSPLCAAVGKRVTSGTSSQPYKGGISTLNLVALNSGKVDTGGIDFGLDYSYPMDAFGLPDLGRLAFHHVSTLTLEYEESDQAGHTNSYLGKFLPTADGGGGYPRYQARMSLGLEQKDWSFTWTTRFIQGMARYTNTNEPAPVPGVYGDFVSDAWYHDISATYNFGNVGLVVGMDNVFDLTPPYINDGVSRTNSNGFLYDYLGRFVYAKMKIDFGAGPAPSPAVPAVAPLPPPPAPVVAPAPTPEKKREFQVFFDFDKSNVTEAAASVIKAAADVVKSGGVAHVTVTGHTDTVGSAKYNQGLSERRAAAVKATMVSDGVDGGEITTIGVGKTGLLVPTADGVREPQNRRAVIELQ